MSRLACRLDRSNEPYPFGAILRTIARVVVHNGKGLKGGGPCLCRSQLFPARSTHSALIGRRSRERGTTAAFTFTSAHKRRS